MQQDRPGSAAPPVKARAAAIFASPYAVVADRWEAAMSRAAVVSQSSANLVSLFLPPTAVLALAFGLWRLGTDLGWTHAFPVGDGLFSHWIVWIALAGGLQMTRSLMVRPPRSKN